MLILPAWFVQHRAMRCQRWQTSLPQACRLDAAEAVIHPFLVRNDISTIDSLVVSHGSNDHIGGADTLLNRYAVTNLYTSVPDKLIAHNALPCIAGCTWQWDGVRFTFLHPVKHDYQAALDENNLSCVLSIQTSQQRILLTGDIEQQGELLLTGR